MPIGGRPGAVPDRAAAKDKKSDGTESVEQLKIQYEEAKNKIRALIGGRSDKNDLKQETKDELRREYTKAARLAKQISQRLTDEKESAIYAEAHEKLSAKAASYGSVMKNEIPKTTMDDIKGNIEVKKLVDSFLFMAEHPEILKYYKIDGGLGVLMYGAPGTGKTMFAEAIANRMQLPLFVVTPADIFKSYVGASEQAVRAIFEDIESCPDGAVLFIDECESIFSRRTESTQDYKAAVTTELLQRINGFGVDGSRRIMIGATNRPDMIDSAYLRYKRFSYLIHIAPPDPSARKAIIESKLGNIALQGCTKADIVAMANEGRTIMGGSGELINDPTKAQYSAADLCGIIEEACRLTLETIQERKLTTTLPVDRENFVKAFRKIPASISPELFKRYEDFRTSMKA